MVPIHKQGSQIPSRCFGSGKELSKSAVVALLRRRLERTGSVVLSGRHITYTGTYYSRECIDPLFAMSHIGFWSGKMGEGGVEVRGEELYIDVMLL